MYMDDVMVFAKNEEELETLMQAVRINRHYIEREFGIEKCAMFIMKYGKRETAEGIELQN